MKTLVSIIAICILSSCKDFALQLNNDTKDSVNSIENNSVIKSESPKPVIDETVINVEPTLVRPQLFLMMQDCAEDLKTLHEKQKVIYNNLDYILKKYNLQPMGEPIAWHYRKSNLFVVEAGIPLVKKLTKKEDGTFYKQTTRGKAVVAHFFGKHSLLPRAYDSLNVWLKENHQSAIGNPWEVYVSDPRVMKEHDFLQTDVYSQAK